MKASVMNKIHDSVGILIREKKDKSEKEKEKIEDIIFDLNKILDKIDDYERGK